MESCHEHRFIAISDDVILLAFLWYLQYLFEVVEGVWEGWGVVRLKSRAVSEGVGLERLETISSEALQSWMQELFFLEWRGMGRCVKGISPPNW